MPFPTAPQLVPNDDGKGATHAVSVGGCALAAAALDRPASGRAGDESKESGVERPALRGFALDARPQRLRERQQSLGLSGPSCRPGLGLCNAMSESACGGAIAHSEEAEEAGGDGWELGGRAVARGASSFGLEGSDLEGWPSTCDKTGARTLDLGLLW